MTKKSNIDFAQFEPLPMTRGEKIKSQLRVGMSVTFGQPGGEQTDGVVVKINKKNVKVRTAQPRGKAPAGTEWNVSPGLITIREGADIKVPSRKEVALDRIVKIMRENGISLKDVAATVKGG